MTTPQDGEQPVTWSTTTTRRDGASVDGARARQPGPRPRAEGRAADRAAGFTIVELLVSIIIIFLLVTLLVVAVNRAKSAAGTAAERQTVSAMKTGVEYFQNEFGFLPPLVKDNNSTKYPKGPILPQGPLGLNGNPVVYRTSNKDDLIYLRGDEVDDDGSNDYRFSEYSIPYYLIGVLGAAPDGEPIDGVVGPGFKTPERDGSFEKSGREFQPFFDPPGRAQGVVEVNAEEGRFELRGSKGFAYRYYRWEPGRATGENVGQVIDTPEDYNVPAIVGDAGEDPELRGARFAIVSAGPNGVLGDDTEGMGDPETFWQQMLGRAASTAQLLRKAREDNVVEVGR